MRTALRYRGPLPPVEFKPLMLSFGVESEAIAAASHCIALPAQPVASTSDGVVRKKLGKKACYSCGSMEHLAFECQQTRCHYCGVQGHMARDCHMGQTAAAKDSFILCHPVCGSSPSKPESRCFVRRFVIPMTERRVSVGPRPAPPNLFPRQRAAGGGAGANGRCRQRAAEGGGGHGNAQNMSPVPQQA